MRQDFQGNLIGKGEDLVLEILKEKTKLAYRDKKYFHYCNGLYTQIPVKLIYNYQDLMKLSPEQMNSSIDIFIKLNQKRVAVRVQGFGHGNHLKGLGKAKFDKAQMNLLKDYCEVVNINQYDCPNIFKEKDNENARLELEQSFENSNVIIPTIN